MIGAVLLVWACCVAVVSAVAIVRRVRLKPVAAHPPRRPVLLLRPCAGDEPGLEERLTHVSPLAGLSVRLTVASASDAAWPIIQTAAARLSGAGVAASAHCVEAIGPNQKVGQLATATVGDAVVVCADSDVNLGNVDLAKLVAPIIAGQHAATWIAPAEQPGATLGDRASAAFLNGSLHAFALLGALDPAGLVGKLFAVDGPALHAVGGFAAFRDVLGEDMALARALAEQGHTSRLVPGIAPAHVSGRTPQQVVERYARWFAVIRAQRPALLLSYPLLFGATTPLVVFGCLAGGWGIWAAALALGTRLTVGFVARKYSGGPVVAAIVDVPLAECVTWAAFLRTLSTRTISWRGRRLRLDASGRLVEPPDA